MVQSPTQLLGYVLIGDNRIKIGGARRVKTSSLAGIFLIMAIVLAQPFVDMAPMQSVLPEGEVIMSTDKPCYRPGEFVHITATGWATVPSVGDFPYIFWAITNASGDHVFEAFNPFLAIGGINGTLNGTWNQTYRLFGGKPPSGMPVPPGSYTIWFYEIPPPNETIPSWIPEEIIIGECPTEIAADAGEDQTVYEGEIVQFNGSGSRGSSERIPSVEIGKNIMVNEYRPNATWRRASPSIAVDSEDSIHVVWPNHGEEYFEIYYSKKLRNESLFKGEKKISDIMVRRYYPDIAVDTSGRIFVVWMDERAGDHDVYLVKSEDGGNTFSSPKRVNDDETSDVGNVRIAVDPLDTVHVAWIAWKGDFYIYYSKSLDHGLTFTSPVVVNDNESDIHGNSLDFAVDNSGNAHFAFPDGRDKDCPIKTHFYPCKNVYYTRTYNGGSSFIPSFRVNDVIGSLYGGYEIAADGNDNPHIAWRDIREGDTDGDDWMDTADVYYARSFDKGGSFNPDVKVNHNGTNGMWYFAGGASIDVHEDGTPHVSWMDGRNGNWDIYYSVSLDKGSNFSDDFKVNDDPGYAFQISDDIVVDSLGHPHHVWSDNRSFRKIIFDNSEIWYANGTISLGGEVEIVSYQWDFNNHKDSDGDGNLTNDVDATGPTPTHVYGDNVNFTVTLKVTDELGNWDTDTMNATVLNVPPDVTASYTCVGGGPTDIFLRIAGEKWHDVSFTVYEDGKEIYNGTLLRVPGSPNEQMIGLEDFSFNISRSHSAIVKYTPEDDKVNGQEWGATPAWIIFKSSGKEIARLHQSFNVRRPETWEWRVDDLSSFLPERECTFTADIYDPGSDDMHVTWDWGDGTTTEYIYYNNGVSPDPYPSPDVNPITITDIAYHSYSSAGSYTITLTVRDDDGGSEEISLTLNT